MGQLISTILQVIVLLIVPLGVVHIHTVLQARNELLEISLGAAKYISNYGGTNDMAVHQNVRQFVTQELTSKNFHLTESDIEIAVTRTIAAEPILWSHEDEFELRLEIQTPHVSNLFPDWDEPIFVVRTGTINKMDYDL